MSFEELKRKSRGVQARVKVAGRGQSSFGKDACWQDECLEEARGRCGKKTIWEAEAVVLWGAIRASYHRLQERR